MIAWLKALLAWVFNDELKKLKAENAQKEAQLIAAVQSPDAAPELLEQATIYFSAKPSTKKLRGANNGSR